MTPEGAEAALAKSSESNQVSFDDNSLLPLLYGQHDRNLARIEQLAGVALIARGNVIGITGDDGARRVARRALEFLYDRIKRGFDPDLGEVDAAVRLAAAGSDDAQLGLFGAGDLVIRTRKRHVAPRTAGQTAYLRALGAQDLVFGVGPAGTGKTYLAVAVAVSMLLKGDVDRIILSRPAVEAGERLGFLPGDLREKVDPYLRPLYDALHDMMPGDQVAKRISSGDIEIAPLAFMRGRTLANAFVILDEAQNTTPMQMKMLVTRLGENSRMVVTGDLTQIDLPSGMRSGLRDALDILRGVEGVAVVTFDDSDVIRHPLVMRIVRAYDKKKPSAGAGADTPEPATPGHD